MCVSKKEACSISKVSAIHMPFNSSSSVLYLHFTCEDTTFHLSRIKS